MLNEENSMTQPSMVDGGRIDVFTNNGGKLPCDSFIDELLKLEDFNDDTILTEGIHLVAYAKNEDGEWRTIEDNDYPSKKAFADDLKANGYTNIKVKDDADLWLLDNSNYASMSALERDLRFAKKLADESPNITVWKTDYENLKNIYDKAKAQLKQ